MTLVISETGVYILSIFSQDVLEQSQVVPQIESLQVHARWCRRGHLCTMKGDSDLDGLTSTRTVAEYIKKPKAMP